MLRLFKSGPSAFDKSLALNRMLTDKLNEMTEITNLLFDFVVEQELTEQWELFMASREPRTTDPKSVHYSHGPNAETVTDLGPAS